MQAILNYFKGSVQEFNSITWPTRKQAIRISAITLIFMAVCAVILGFLDQLLALGYQMILKLPL